MKRLVLGCIFLSLLFSSSYGYSTSYLIERIYELKMEENRVEPIYKSLAEKYSSHCGGTDSKCFDEAYTRAKDISGYTSIFNKLYRADGFSSRLESKFKRGEFTFSDLSKKEKNMLKESANALYYFFKNK